MLVALLAPVAVFLSHAPGHSPADDLVVKNFGPIRLRVPAAWNYSESGGTHTFADPSEQARVLVDFSAVKTKGMKAEECVAKITSGIGGSGWEPIFIGSKPAAKQVIRDVVPNSEDEVYTYNFVGCDGATTWSITAIISAKKDRFGPLAEEIARSLEYSKPRKR